MKKVYNLFIILISSLVLILSAHAQTENTSSINNNNIRKPTVLTPYIAEAVSETIQILGNGNKIKRSTKEVLYSDGGGRVRRETEIISGANKTQKTIYIRDWQGGIEYYLNPITKIAYRTPIKKYSVTDSQRVSPIVGYSTKSEDLGKKIIEGFEARGLRSITTIAAGIIGNEQPLEMISENWYAPELSSSILTNRKDPQSGDYTYEMKNIKREMPDASLFVVPFDYKIVEQQSLNDRYFTVDAPK